jgi:predicted phage terminase large subunit-like protein
MLTLTEQEIEALAANIGHFSPEEQKQIAIIIDELDRRRLARACQMDLLEFCKHMDPTYVVAPHHKKLAELLQQIAYGQKDRIAVSIPPRHGKSHLVSTLFPAWFLGKFPEKKVLMVSHTGDLAVDFGRKVRNIIADPRYTSIFPGITLAADSKSAGRWSTNKGGEYFATGVGAALAGRGADLLLVDDPHSEQDLLAGNFEELEKTYQWFAFGARTRLMSGGRIAVIHTRWHQDDLIGHLIKDGANNPKADQYEVFEFPAVLTIKTPIYNTDDEKIDEEVTEKALWPEKFDLEALERTRASMPAFQWNAQYMQNPTGEQGAIIQRDWWMPWKKDDPPECEYIIMALDAAAEKSNRADFTALLTFGVFSDDRLTDGASHIILLNAINVRVEFPELKDLAIQEWKEWQPDSFIVEKKSSGTPLYQELRRLGIPVQEFTPNRGTGDKVARLNAVADILRSGMVWYPEGRRWAEDVIEQSVSFPYGSHDDMVDCLSMVLARYRQGGFVTLPSDYRDPEYLNRPRRAVYY